MKPKTLPLKCVCGYTSTKSHNMVRHAKTCDKAGQHEEVARKEFLAAARGLMLDRIRQGDKVDAAVLQVCIMGATSSYGTHTTDDVGTDCVGLAEHGAIVCTDCAGLATRQDVEGDVPRAELDLGDQDLKAFEWKEVPIATHLERRGIVEYYDACLPTRRVLASIPLGEWGGASFAMRTAVRMYHAMASGHRGNVVESGPVHPCPHDSVACSVVTVVEDAWGEANFVESLEADEGGVFTYMVAFELGRHRVRCGHDLHKYTKDLRVEIFYFWREGVACPVPPHFLGNMKQVVM
jgi:hypothetical protein